MNLLNTSILNGIAVFIKTVTMLVLNKILAVYVGPSGYAVIGQFQNFVQIITGIGGSFINNGIVKYTAEYHEDEQLQQRLWATSSKLIVLFTLLISAIIICSSFYLSQVIFKQHDYWSVFIWLAIFLVFFNLNGFLLAIINGKKEIVKLVSANIGGTLITLAATYILVVSYGLYGALVALAINQSVAFFLTWFIARKSQWYRPAIFWGKIDQPLAKKLSAFALMALVSVVVGNITQFILRSYVVEFYGWDYAGYWDAMNRLSLGYLMFASTIIGVYYLPKLSELKKYNEIKKEVKMGYLVILPIAAFSAAMVYVFKELVVDLLFTAEFTPMLELLFWQLIGDVLRIGSWIVTYMMLSRAMTRLFISLETFFLISIIPLTMLLSHWYGFKGIAIAFAVNNLFYWVTCAFFSYRKLRNDLKPLEV